MSRHALLRRGLGLFLAAAAPASLVDAARAEAAVMGHARKKPKCPPNDVLCKGKCVNRATDDANCGRCGHVCPRGTTCVDGACVKRCPPGEALCSGKCTKIASHPSHCGQCGFRCPAGGVCKNGVCTH